MLTALILAAAAQAAAPVPALTLGEVKPLAGRRTALPLAGRVLPPGIAGRVIEGDVRRQWLPGQIWWLGFRERAEVAGPDLCERSAHAVQLSAPQATEESPADTILTAGALESWREVAVLPPGTRADAERCGAAVFISVRYDPARRIAAYRVLAAAMAAARGGGALPFAVTCRAEKPDACADARAALADLPMDALGGVSVRCIDAEKIRRDGIITCPPLRPGQPYQAEVAFGMSGTDGQSWRVAFVHRPGWPESIALSRSTVIYH